MPGKVGPRAAIPVVRRRIADCRSPDGDKGLQLVELIEAGLQADDDLAADQYVAWLRTAWPRDFYSSPLCMEFSYNQDMLFLPIYRHPENPKLAKLARWLFLAKDSPLPPLHELDYRLVTSPLVGVPAFANCSNAS